MPNIWLSNFLYLHLQHLNNINLFYHNNIMPQISFFYGIYIWMNYVDHNPPHFHAWYGDYKIIVNIQDGSIKGEMPSRAQSMILEWLEIHRTELIGNWEKAQIGAPLDKINPLK